MTVEKIRAVTYSRFSTDKQRDSSIVDQQRNCHARAQAEGWTIDMNYSDAAISGSDKNRPQYLEMQAAAGRREFDVLIMDQLSRFARDSVEQEQAIRRLEFQGIRIVTTSDGYDSRSKARKLHRQVKGAMNEMFLDDLRANVHRGLMGRALKRFWCGGRPYGYKLRLLRDCNAVDAHGEPARIGTMLERDSCQAKIVHEIFSRYADGESCMTIARDLNHRQIPSPGSTWRRKTRRCSGWMGSAVRVILRNPLYTGLQRWNTSQFVQDPDTGKQLRRRRDPAEWVTNQIEGLRIVSDALFERAKARTRAIANPDPRLRQGGVPKRLLSGLLKCGCCGRNYIIADANFYACGSYIGGGEHQCSNSERARQDVLESLILGPIRDDLLHPERVARMAKEMESELNRRMQASAARMDTVPRELRELESRIERLKGRLSAGDPDLTTDELQAAIDRAEFKRRELQAARPEAKRNARVQSLLPKAAELYRKQIEMGLAGDARATAKARLILRDLIGPVALTPGPGKGEFWASYKLVPAALIKATGTSGRGDRI